MKKIILMTLALVMSLTIAVAKAPAKKSVKTTVFTTDIHCHSCVNKIMNNVPIFGKGVKDVKVNVDTKEVTIVYDASKNTDLHLIEAFRSLKVNAEVKGEKPAPEKK